MRSICTPFGTTLGAVHSIGSIARLHASSEAAVRAHP